MLITSRSKWLSIDRCEPPWTFWRWALAWVSTQEWSKSSVSLCSLPASIPVVLPSLSCNHRRWCSLSADRGLRLDLDGVNILCPFVAGSSRSFAMIFPPLNVSIWTVPNLPEHALSTDHGVLDNLSFSEVQEPMPSPFTWPRPTLKESVQVQYVEGWSQDGINPNCGCSPFPRGDRFFQSSRVVFGEQVAVSPSSHPGLLPWFLYSGTILVSGPVCCCPRVGNLPELVFRIGCLCKIGIGVEGAWVCPATMGIIPSSIIMPCW
jgi:hypothetical protein